MGWCTHQELLDLKEIGKSGKWRDGSVALNHDRITNLSSELRRYQQQEIKELISIEEVSTISDNSSACDDTKEPSSIRDPMFSTLGRKKPYPEWTTLDQEKLLLLRKLNQGPIHVDTDRLWALEAKKKAHDESKINM